MTEFRKEIQQVINKYSKENGSDTPDFVLARYLEDTLHAFDRAMRSREEWYGLRNFSVPVGTTYIKKDKEI